MGNAQGAIHGGKVRIRATSDLHLTQATAPYVFAALDQMRKDATKWGGVTVICGDLFDQAVSVNMPLWNRLKDLLRAFRGSVVLVPGNHDQYDEYRNALEGMAGQRVKVITTADPSVMVDGGHRIGACIPYTRQFDEVFPWCLENRDRRAPNLVFCHHGFKGAYLNEMYKCRRGGSVRMIPGDTLVVSGHYHMPQVLGRLIYCGSPYELTFSEEGQKKGWLLWKDASRSLIPIRKPFTDLGAPRHYTLNWTPGDPAPVKPAWLGANDKLRVVVEASRADAPGVSAVLEKAGIVAPITYKPTQSATVATIGDFRGGIMGAVLAEVDRAARVNPQDMREFADSEGLWQDLS